MLLAYWHEMIVKLMPTEMLDKSMEMKTPLTLKKRGTETNLLNFLDLHLEVPLKMHLLSSPSQKEDGNCASLGHIAEKLQKLENLQFHQALMKHHLRPHLQSAAPTTTKWFRMNFKQIDFETYKRFTYLVLLCNIFPHLSAAFKISCRIS